VSVIRGIVGSLVGLAAGAMVGWTSVAHAQDASLPPSQPTGISTVRYCKASYVQIRKKCRTGDIVTFSSASAGDIGERSPRSAIYGNP
jgi:hypothetical protein